MIVMTIQNLKKSFGGNEVLRDISLVLKDGDRLGLVGVNGCGKTTLLKILAGLDRQDEGSIALAKGLRIGYLAQQNQAPKGKTVYEVLDDVYEPVRDMETKLRRMEEGMANAQDEKELTRLGDSYARLNDAFEKADGYSYRSLIQGVLAGLGFEKSQYTQEAALLSGGEMTRLCLARLLLQKPDVLLLDEPTNHLDLDALNWLENYLKDYRGSLIVVSHDRFFLDRVCTGIAEILMGVMEQYPGNYTKYMALRQERFLTREREFDAQQKEIARQQEIIRKLRAFNREKSIKRAESRVKMLDKIELKEKPQEEKQIFFHFTAARRTGDDVLAVREFSKGFDEKKLFEHISLTLSRGDRAALIGRNGIGKSTLFKCLTGELAPDSGTVRWGANVDVGYYDQHQRTLHNNKTILDEVWDAFPRMEQTDVRGALSQFLFTGEDVFEKIGTLSGGERGRVALTKLMLQKDNLLLLDEPTNHLDMDSREVLEDALDGFDGTILAISHDRYFINRFATRVLELTPEGILVYEGNFDDYLAAKAKENMPPEDPAVAGKTRTEIAREKRRDKDEKARVKALKEAAAQAERDVQAAEQAVADYEAYMALPTTYQDSSRAEETAREYKRLKDALAKAYDAWEEAELAIEE